jgi:outer membrane protein TolC
MRAIACSALILASGCGLPPRFPEKSQSGLLAAQPTASYVSTKPRTPVGQPDSEFAGEHPVEFYVQAALRRNPAIRAAERRAAAALDEYPQVTALPDPMLENSFAPIPGASLQTAGGRVTNSLTLSQRFPWFGKLRLRGEVADREAQIALAELAEEELRVVEEVKAAYFDLLYYRDAIRITKDNETFLKQYIALADSMYKVGRASQQDLLRAQVELSRLEENLIELGRQSEAVQADLARLLSISPETDIRPAGGLPEVSVPEQIDSLYQMAIAYRPELQGRLTAIVRDQERAELARLEYFPDVNLGVNWMAMTANQALAPTADGLDNIAFGVGINLPIWRDKLSAGVRQANNRQAESIWRYEAARDDALRMVRRLMVQARALDQQVNLLRREIIPRAEQTLKTSEADYRVGKVDALQVLSNFTDLLRFRIQLVRFESMLGQALASLERVIGIELARPDEGKPKEKGAELAPPRPVK